MGRSIFFSVGEPSGDQHAARLIAALKKLDSDLQVRGFGGPKMLSQGLAQDFDLTQLAVIGFAEVLPKLRQFFSLKAQAKQIFVTQRPDAVILVDFPGFNWHIAAVAHKLKIPVFYYLPPQLWAWGQWRISKMKRTVDHVLCAMPIERDYFQKHGMDAVLVGHPFFEHVAQEQLDQYWLQSHRADSVDRVAVLPGSRRREINAIWPLQIKVIQELHHQYPNIRFDIACLSQKHQWICESIYSDTFDGQAALPIEFHSGKTSEAIEASLCVLTKSGSVSLELLMRNKPACVLYHATHSTYAIGRTLSNVKYFSLPNILADREIVPEFLAIGKSDRVVPSLVNAMQQLIGDSKARAKQIEALRAVQSTMGSVHASTEAADIIKQRLGWT